MNKVVLCISVIGFLFFPDTSRAARSLCKEDFQVSGKDSIDLKKIVLTGVDDDDERSLDQLMKALSSNSSKRRGGAIKYLSNQMLTIKNKYSLVYHVVYARILEVAKSDPNPDLQFGAFKILYEENPVDRNLAVLAETHPQLYEGINESIDDDTMPEGLIIEDGVYREDD